MRATPTPISGTHPAPGGTDPSKFRQIVVTPDMHLSAPGMAALRDLSARPLVRLASLDPARIVAEHGAEIAEADALVSAWQSELSAPVLRCFPHLHVIALRATSTKRVDLDYTRALGIAVANIEGYGDTGTTEFVLQHLLRFARDLPTAGGGLPGELRGKQLGLIGFGAVAQLVGHAAVALGMRVSYHVPRLGAKARPAWATYQPLAGLLGQSDFISFHSPAFQPVVTREDLERIRPGAGLLVTTLGLPFALEDFTGWMAHARNPAAFDMCAAHACADDLRRYPSVTVWNAYSARTTESVQRAEALVLGNLRRFLGNPEPWRTGVPTPLDLAATSHPPRTV